MYMFKGLMAFKSFFLEGKEMFSSAAFTIQRKLTKKRCTRICMLYIEQTLQTLQLISVLSTYSVHFIYYTISDYHLSTDYAMYVRAK